MCLYSVHLYSLVAICELVPWLVLISVHNELCGRESTNLIDEHCATGFSGLNITSLHFLGYPLHIIYLILNRSSGSSMKILTDIFDFNIPVKFFILRLI